MLDPQYTDAIKGFEGYAPEAKWDYKQNSNGYGTRALYPGEKIDQATAEQRFNEEIVKAHAHVEGIAPDAPPGVKAALTSLTYNAGPGWATSGLGDMVRAGDWAGAAERFQQYNKAGGQVNPGLVARRAKEAAWFNAGPPMPTAGLGQPMPPQQRTAPTSVPGSFQGVAQPPQAQNNAPAGFSGASPSPSEAQTDPMQQMLGAPQLPNLLRQRQQIARAYFNKIPLPADFRGT